MLLHPVSVRSAPSENRAGLRIRSNNLTSVLGVRLSSSPTVLYVRVNEVANNEIIKLCFHLSGLLLLLLPVVGAW